MKNNLKLEVLDGETMAFALAEDFSKEITFNGELITVVVPKGMRTDLASIPRPLWNLIAPFGRYEEAAVLHDFLYQHGGLLFGLPKKLNRKEADALFKQVMLADDVNKRKAWLMWASVRIFGRKFWLKN